jgi:hypothetical protein
MTDPLVVEMSALAASIRLGLLGLRDEPSACDGGFCCIRCPRRCAGLCRIRRFRCIGITPRVSRRLRATCLVALVAFAALAAASRPS